MTCKIGMALAAHLHIDSHTTKLPTTDVELWYEAIFKYLNSIDARISYLSGKKITIYILIYLGMFVYK